jgi:pullulanase
MWSYLSSDSSRIEVFAPAAKSVHWLIFESDSATLPALTIPMKKQGNGFFTAKCDHYLIDKFYAFSFRIGNKWTQPLLDIGVIATGINGQKGGIIDFATTNPTGWETDNSPLLDNPVDAIIYELHIRDFTVHPHSGIKNRGLFEGFTELNTKSPKGHLTGLSHLKELGITHIQLMPVFDFDSVDEEIKSANNYNWGYDPYHWNVPEGSYSSDPSDPVKRIIELKSLILACHQEGIGVIMDVVYNHFSEQRALELELIAPNIFFRKWKDGSLANGSGCGNEVATEHAQVREFILKSLLFWVQEYHIDGFRFDLMGLIDLQTLEMIKSTLQTIRPNILIYGEGWTGGPSPIIQQHRGIKNNTHRIGGIGIFNDDFRDAVKGHVFNHHQGGFIQGFTGFNESVKFGIAGAVYHPQIDYSKVNYSDASWAISPSECINYISCHDNLTLWDKISVVRPELSLSEKKKIHLLGLTLLMVSQGVPFLHSGLEMLRSKKLNDNSYKSGDEINQLDWSLKHEHKDVFNYLKSCIDFRKKHPAFRCKTGEEIRKWLHFTENMPDCVLSFTLGPHANGDEINYFLFLANGSNQHFHFSLPPGEWGVIMQDYVFSNQTNALTHQIDLNPGNCMLLYLLEN